jgi:hypothetical protein
LNEALKQPVVAKVGRSRKGNITLQITAGFKTETVLSQKDKIQAVFRDWPVTAIEAPKTWARIVVHEVPLTGFSEPLGAFISPGDADDNKGLKALKADIEAFNPIEIQGQPKWLKTPKEGQAIGSIVLALTSERARSRCILQGLLVVNQRLKVVPYRDTLPKTLYGRY